MKTNQEKELIDNWLFITNIQMNISNELETALRNEHNLSLKEFYVLYFLSETDEKKLRLQQLQELVGLSQSAMSRLVARLEEKSCGVLERLICEDDRRGIYTHLTKLGEEKLQTALNTFYHVLHSCFAEGNLKQELQAFIRKL